LTSSTAPTRAADLPQLVGCEDSAPTFLPPGDTLELAELFERVDADVRVGADAERDSAMPHANGREEAVSEISLCRRAGADRRAAVAQKVELRTVRMGRVDDRRPVAEAAAVGEQLDGTPAMLREAFLDLPGLLVGVDVEHEVLGVGVAAELHEPVSRAGAHGVGGNPHRDSTPAQLLELLEVRGHRRLTHPLQAAARVGDVQAHEPEPRLGGGLRGRESGVEAEVVELADRREAGSAHLAVGRGVELEHRPRGLGLGLGQHALAPGPEVASRGPAAKRALEGMAVGVDEPGERHRSRHGRRH
jgi:hypothetical protein